MTQSTLLTAVFCCLFMFSIKAQTTWTGATDNDWNTATNWTNNTPATGNDATIPAGGTPVLTLTGNTVFDYSIANAGILTVDLAGFNLNNDGLLANSGEISLSGSGTFSNLVNIENGGVFTSSVLFTNSFTGTVSNTDTLNLAGTTINFSTINNGGVLQITGDFDNNSVLTNFTDGTISNAANFDNISGGFINNGGILENEGAGVLANFGTVNNEGTLRNTGTFNVENTGLLDNLAAGVVENQGDFFNRNDISNNGTFTNLSCFTFTGEAGSSSSNNTTGIFTNDGTVYRLENAVVQITDGSGSVLTDANESPAPDMNCFFAVTKNLDATGSYTLTLNEIDSSSTVGYCTVAQRILSRTEFDCTDVGEQIVTLSITDDLGTTGTCETRVTIADDSPPTLACPDDIEVTLEEGDCNEVVTYTVTGSDNCGDTVTQTDDSGLTSGDVFPNGTTVQSYAISDSATTTTCSFNVTVSGAAESGGPIVCNDNLNISLDGMCEYTLSANGLLQGGPVCQSDYTFLVNDVPTVTIDAAFIGQTVMFSVVEVATGNSCWGNALIEDKLAPQVVTCPDTLLTCLQNSDPVSEGGDAPDATFTDCSEFFSFYQDTTLIGGCDSTFARRIIRTWTATDIFGNSSTCEQIITVERIDFEEAVIECPADFTAECIAGTDFDLTPAVTGFPTVTYQGETYELMPGDGQLCDIIVSISDEDFPMCSGSQKIIRTWSVYNWCEPIGSAGNPFTCTQSIEITDNTPPLVTAPDDFTVSVNENCVAIFELPPATAVDCSEEITWITRYSTGIISGNGGMISEPGLTIGTDTILYTASDACGNSATDTTIITIIDELPPIAVCDLTTIVTLTEGIAQVTVTQIDNGSFDNCCLESVLIARMEDNCGNPDDLFFDESVEVCCADVGQETMVILQVTDCYGNQNICMAPVTVVDNEMPEIVCPADVTVSCDADIDAQGEPTVIDNCGEPTVTVEVNDMTDCAGGMVIRTFTATDGFGNTATCSQTILVLPPDLLTEDDITCPEDFIATGCTPNTEPEITGMPEIDAPNCVETTLDYSDVSLPGSGDFCVKIIRTWVITDPCIFDGNPENGGYFECQQSIFIQNTDAPTVSCPVSALIFCSDENDCAATDTDLTITYSDDCTATEDLEVFWTVDINADGIADSGSAASGIGLNVGNTYPVGSHLITYKIKDDCGNTTECEFIFLVNDCGNPTAVCPGGINIELAADATISLFAEQISTPGSFDNCSANADLTLSFSADLNDTERQFSCEDVGNMIDLPLFVTDEAGNQGSCTIPLQVQDNENVCPQNIMIAGLIATENGQFAEEVAVEIESADMTEAVTDAAGHYEYTEAAYGENYHLTPTSGDDWGNGVTTWDIIYIRQHVLTTQPITSPYRLIAADVNNSGSVTTADAIALRSFILQLTDDFPDNSAWRYIDANYAFPDAENPWAEIFPESVNLSAVNQSAMQNDFIAVKIGDLNGSATPNNLTNDEGDARSDKAINFRTQERQFAAGETVTVEIFAESPADLFAYQMTFDFDPDLLEFINLTPGESHQRNNFGLRKTGEGAITCSWDKALTGTINTNAFLFSVNFRARKAGALSEAVNLGSRFTPAAAYSENGETFDINLQFTDATGEQITDRRVLLYQNRPNPFRTETAVGFWLPQADDVRLNVFDTSGKLLLTKARQAPAGYGEFMLQAADLPQKGVLFYELVTTEGKVGKRMILTR